MPEAPYMYAPSRPASGYPHSVFDPKAVSRASLVPPPPKPQQNGPLIDFNKHPDSWQIRPLAKPDVEPMDPRIKRAVTVVRSTQLGLRFLSLIIAAGTLFCVICIKGIGGSNQWVMRIPPGLDMLITSYGIWHLVRGANHRTPASSASYHFFALVMDAGLIPFYVFTVLLTRAEFVEKDNTDGRWTTFFSGSFQGVSATDIILHTTWILAIVAGSVHVVHFFIASWLAYIFREITMMPPDMNPLEDNLTSRRKTKHKYKNSELSEKHLSAASQSTFSVVNASKVSGVSAPVGENGRPVSFFHTRTDSGLTYSPHNPRTAHASRHDISSMYQQPVSNRASRVDAYAQEGARSADQQPHLKSMSSSVYSGEAAPEVPLKSSKREILSDNWFVTNDENAAPRNDDPVSELSHKDENLSVSNLSPLSSMDSSVSNPYHSRRRNANANANWSSVPLGGSNDRGRFQDQNLALHPLGMNPPTPRPTNSSRASLLQPKSLLSLNGGINDSPMGRALTTTSGNAATSTSRPSVGISSVAAPKSRYYGDLMAATQGIRGNSPTSSPGNRGHRPTGSVSPTRVPLPASPHTGRGIGLSGNGNEKHYDAQGRVISSSGAERYDGWGGNGRRDVSGKVVEEGRGGNWDGWRRRVSLKRFG